MVGLHLLLFIYYFGVLDGKVTTIQPTYCAINTEDESRELMDLYIEEIRNDKGLHFLSEYEGLDWYYYFIKKIISTISYTEKDLIGDDDNEIIDCFLLYDGDGDDDEEIENIVPIIMPNVSDINEMFKISDAMGLGFVNDYYKFVEKLINENETDKNLYCNSLDQYKNVTVFWRLFRYYSCSFFMWMYSKTNNVTFPENSTLIEQFFDESGELKFKFKDDLIQETSKIIQYDDNQPGAVLPIKELLNESGESYNKEIQLIKNKINEKYPKLRSKYDSLSNNVNILWSSLNLEENLNFDKIKELVDATMKSLIPEIYELKYQTVSQETLHRIHHYKEEKIAKELNASHTLYSNDPGAVMRMREKVKILSEAGIRFYVSSDSRERKNFLLSGTLCPTYEGFAPWEENRFSVTNLRSWGRLGYLVVFVWVFGINVNETQCRRRFPFVPDSVYNCRYPVICLEDGFLAFIEFLFPGFDIFNAQCEDYNTFASYWKGILILLTLISRPPNLIPCLIWNAWIPFIVLSGVFVIVTVLLVSSIIIIGGWLNDLEKFSKEMEMDNIESELIRSGRRSQLQEFESNGNVRSLFDNQGVISSALTDLIEDNKRWKTVLSKEFRNLKGDLKSLIEKM